MTSTDTIINLLSEGKVSATEAERLLKALQTSSAPRSTSTSRSTSVARAASPRQDEANKAYQACFKIGAPYGTATRIARFASKLVHQGADVDDAVAKAIQVVELVADSDDPKAALKDAFNTVVPEATK